MQSYFDRESKATDLITQNDVFVKPDGSILMRTKNSNQSERSFA
jgi:hypothetical protein